jgi:tRNA threonylcarbamoyladenosine biosynthesis protein TsaB
MRLLALDTATAACSVALRADGKTLARRHAVMARGQSEALMPMIAEIMAEARLTFADLDLLAVTVGPGAFTGIRIGLASARGLALATGLPLAGIATTEAVAAAVPAAERRGRTILVALDSKREDLWVQSFRADLTALTPPAAALPAAAVLGLGPAVVVGDAADCLLPLLTDAIAASAPGTPDAAWVAHLAERHWRAGTALPPEPLYLRPADVTMPRQA